MPKELRAAISPPTPVDDLRLLIFGSAEVSGTYKWKECVRLLYAFARD